jgi:hypothetical protein
MSRKPKILRFKKEPVKLSDIKVEPDPQLHAALPAELEARIRKFGPVFAEIFSKSDAEWVEGFKHDLHPESEVANWEAMASAYQSLLAIHALPLPAKKEALARMCSWHLDTQPRHLTPSQAEELKRLFTEAIAKQARRFESN